MNFFLLILVFILTSCNAKQESWHGGVDSNNNGIRDDIESWIEEKYSNEKRIQHALLNLAAVDPASCEYKDKIICLDQVSDDSIVLQLELLEKTLDTSQRRIAFEKRVQKCVLTDDRALRVKCNF